MKDRAPNGRAKSGFHRRDFLRGSGAAAAATALAGGGGLATAQEEAPATFSAGMHKITLVVNGEKKTVEVEPRMTLLEALRYRLGLTGAKPVSDEGNEGASNVLLDGKPVSAANLLAMQCIGHEIQTVESLGGAKPDPVPVAFTHADAQQCGFCTPGFVVAVRAFLNKHPGASEAEIRAGLNGNLCRCGTYYDVITAAVEAAGGAQAAKGAIHG